MSIVCDFCSSPAVRWTFAARDFVLDAEKTGLRNDEGAPLDWGSREGWAACEPCKRLVMATDREGLAARAARRWHRKNRGNGHRYAETLRAVRTAQDGFWVNRTQVEPVPSSPDELTDPTRPHG